MLEPRKRPSQQRSRATYDAIVEAAARILEHDGLAALSTNAIAERAGVSVGSVYQYFPGKHAILVGLIRRERSALFSHIQRADAQSQNVSLLDALPLFIAAGIAHQLDRPVLAAALEYAEAQMPLDDEASELAEGIIGILSKHLAKHRICNPDIAARDLLALSRGIIDAAGRAKEVDRANLAERVLRAVRGYLIG